MGKKLTTEIFIERAKLIYEERYLYDQVKYINSKTKVLIFCKKCNKYFEQTPDTHLRGCGCFVCSKSKMNKESFVKRAIEIHGDLYLYDKIIYINAKSKVKIFCKKCNEYFEKIANEHIRKGRASGCKKCSISKRRSTTEEFVKKSLLIHGNLYSYHAVEYAKNSGVKVKIFCKKCNEYFYQSPNNHLSGKKCNICANKIMNNNIFIKKAIKIHGDRYRYDQVKYINSKNKVKIFCVKCNDYFYQSPNSHLSSKGCNICNGNLKLTTKEFIAKAVKIHGDKYLYDQVKYINSKTKVKIFCNACKEYFLQIPESHILRKYGCSKCGIKSNIEKRKYSIDEIIKRCKAMNGDKYNYDQVKNVNNIHDKISILCNTCNEIFTQEINSHMNRGCGCPKCAYIKNREMCRDTKDDFIKKAIKIHGYLYDYSKVNYTVSQEKVEIICSIRGHGSFFQHPYNHLFKKYGCPKCGNIISYSENEIYDFIKENYEGEIQQNSRSIIKPYELDIYLPELKLAIEFNGLYWHSEEYKPNDYHLNKTNMCEKNGIHLIHIFEDQWEHKKDIVKSRLLNLLGKNETKIYGRQCIIKEVDYKETKDFLIKNHIQGGVNSKVNLGLYYDNILVSLMTFGKLRLILGQKHKEGHYELLRFCNKKNTSVVGSANKLFKYFIKNYKYKEIISYADRFWTYEENNVYKMLGFNLENITKPNYFYVTAKRRENRFNYRKDVLVSQGYDKDKSGHQIMLERKIYRIYNSGQLKYSYKGIDNG